MIGKYIKGNSFYHCLKYCLEDKRDLTEEQKIQLSNLEGTVHKNRAEVLEYNNCYGTITELAEQFNDVRKLKKGIDQPVVHLTIRLATGDQLTSEQFAEVGRAAAEEFGFSKNQYVCILHRDTKQPHIHVVGNRIGYDGKVATDSHNYRRMAAFCRKMEKKYKLREVLSPRQFLPPKERQIPRQDQRKEQLKRDIRSALTSSRNYPAFEKAMREKGYQVLKGRGIAFEDCKKVRIKGSEVGYSWQRIEKMLAIQQRLENIPFSMPQEIQPILRMGQAEAHLQQSWEKLDALTLGNILSPQVSQGLSELLQLLLQSEEYTGSLSSIWEEEERRRRKRARHRH